MTDGQYRALVAYMQHWPKLPPHFGFDQAIKDIGITDDRETIIDELKAAGWIYERTGILRYQG